jgi:RNA polymerase sigma-70 factor (ECF subfamily)
MNLTELHKRACAGNRIAEKQLFQHLKLSFELFLQHKVGNTQDIEDIVQNALLVISRKYREIRIESSFAAWANRVLHNKLLEYFKFKMSKKYKAQMHVDNCDLYSDFETDPIFLNKLLKCLKKIHYVNVNHARILNLHYLGFSPKEICKKFNWTPNNFYVKLHNARNLLQACLEDGEQK